MFLLFFSNTVLSSFQTNDHIKPVIPYALYGLFLFNFTGSDLKMAGRFTKTVNAFASVYSFLKSSVSGKPVVSALPLFISAELTNYCNLQCPECASGSGTMKRERGFMDPDLYKKVLSELTPHIYYLNLYFQGEPMLHPDFFSFLEPARGIRTVVATNGHFLAAGNSEKIVMSGLGKLIVSLDGMDPETYSVYRKGGDFNKVTEGIRNITSALKKHKSAMKLEIQLLVNRYNEHQIIQVKKFAKEAGASLKLKSMQIIRGRNAGTWLPSDKKYSRYRNDRNGFIIKSSLPDRCWRLWFNPVITWDGKVIPCCFDKDAEYIMGDLTKESLSAIWNGEKFMAFRKMILTGRKNIAMCRNCTSGLKGVKF